MHPHAQLIETFYTQFAQRNYAGMNACYAPEIEFADPVFKLRGKRAKAMWHMLCSGSKGLELTFSQVQADDQRGQAHWEAKYTFSLTGRRVHNILDATFRFEQGKIVWHQDRFDFWRWSRMALGPTGWLLGWTPMVHKRVQGTALKNLEKFIAAHPEYQ